MARCASEEEQKAAAGGDAGNHAKELLDRIAAHLEFRRHLVATFDVLVGVPDSHEPFNTYAERRELAAE